MDRAALLKKGWRRHSVISSSNGGIEILKKYLPEDYDKFISAENCIGIVATYDCAVVHSSDESEPWLQILLAHPTTYEKKYEKCRDSRILHFKVANNGKELGFETCAARICQIDRRFLTKAEPDHEFSIAANNKENLKMWLAERYRQDTWPDALNTALGPAEKRLKSLWNRYNDFVSAFYLKLNTYDELSEGKYSVAVIVAIEEGRLRDLKGQVRSRNKNLKQSSSDDVYKHLENEVSLAFGDTISFEKDRSKISNKAIDFLDESEITLSQLRCFSRYSPYSMSMYGDDTPLPYELIPGKSN